MKKHNNINIGVYGIYTKNKNNLLYIGNSIDLENRYKTHYNELKNKTHINKELIKFSEIYDFDNLIFKPIFLCDEEDLLYWETFFIKLFSPICNKTHIIRNTYNKEKMFIGKDYDVIYDFLNNNEIDKIIKTSILIDKIYNLHNKKISAKKISSVLKQKGYKSKQLSNGERVFIK